MLASFLDFLYPPVCLVSGELLDKRVRQKDPHYSNRYLSPANNPLRNGIPNDILYPGLRRHPVLINNQENAHQFSLNGICWKCGEDCAEEDSPICTACEVWPPVTHQLRSLFRYNTQIENVLKAYKYRLKRPLSDFFGNALAEAIIGNELCPPIFQHSDWDMIIPLPSSPNKTRERGFSHMGLVAKNLSKHINLPVEFSALKCKRKRENQVDLSAAQRIANVEDAFSAKRERINGANILLVDDMTTTGASIWSATCTLLDAGANKVDAITIARSKQFHSLRLTTPVQRDGEKLLSVEGGN